MRICVQRVSRASVVADGVETGRIGKGLLLLAGVRVGDTAEDVRWAADKCAGLRIFEDDGGKMNLSVRDVGGSILCVTNFTLCADCAHGRRPSFTGAEVPEKAKPLTELFVTLLREAGIPVQTGVFGADMKVELLNDGPITLIMDSASGRNIVRPV